MLDEQFKMEVVERLATIEQKIENMVDKVPICLRHTVEEKVSTNRKLIFFLMSTMVLLVGAFLKVNI